MKRYICFVLALVVLAAAIGVACEGTDQSAYEALLGTIPDTPETRNEVHIADYALARQVFDTATFPLPGPEDNEAAVAAFTSFEWVNMEPGTSNVDYPGPLSYGFLDQVIYGNYTEMMAENLQYLAFDVRNIDQSILAGHPDQHQQALQGRFDPQAADAALSACSECPAPKREEHKGVLYYRWGEDYVTDVYTTFVPPLFDRLGRGGRIAVLDEYIFRTLGTTEMKALIDVHLKEGSSLADVEEFRLMAGGMSRLRAYTMLLSDAVEAWDLNVPPKVIVGGNVYQGDIDEQLAESGPRLRPYNAYATGAGKDEEGSYMALVLVHADDASAEENVGLLRKRIEEGSSTLYDNPWSDSIDVDMLEINADGRLLLAKLRGRIASEPFDWVFRRDALILYE